MLEEWNYCDRIAGGVFINNTAAIVCSDEFASHRGDCTWTRPVRVMCPRVIAVYSQHTLFCSPGVIREEEVTLDILDSGRSGGLSYCNVEKLRQKLQVVCRHFVLVCCRSCSMQACTSLSSPKSMYEPKFSSFIDNLIEIHEMKAGLWVILYLISITDPRVH